MVNVAGDADDPGSPTYATFGGLLATPPTPPDTVLTKRVDRAGIVTDDPGLAIHNLVAEHVDEVTNHTVAPPFWTFMNSTGTVWDGGSYIHAALFESAVFATGRPITEAYWANVKVANVYRDVLMQCFERRCLTYDPSNDPNWRIEAGNVGQHYHAWRYNQDSGDGTPTSTATTTSTATATATATSTATAPPPPVTDYSYQSQLNQWLDPMASPLLRPASVAFDSDGNGYVLDSIYKPPRIRKYAPDGVFISEWGGTSTEGGNHFSNGIAIDSQDNVYVTDVINERIQKFDASRNYLDEWSQGRGAFFEPRGAAVDSDGNLYVVNTGRHRIEKFNASGEIALSWGSPGNADGNINSPSDVATALNGDVYVLETFNGQVERFDSEGVWLGGWMSQTAYATGIAVDDWGDVYIADGGNHRVLKYTSDGTFLTMLGGNDRIQKFAPDGTYIARWGSSGVGNGQFDTPYGVTLDTNGDVYVGDTGNNRVQKFSPVN